MPTSTETTGGCPVAHGAQAPAGHHGYEPFQMKDPFPAYAELRSEQPVMFDERTGFYVVSRYEDIKSVFDDWETFSSENASPTSTRYGRDVRRHIPDSKDIDGYLALSDRDAAIWERAAVHLHVRNNDTHALYAYGIARALLAVTPRRQR